MTNEQDALSKPNARNEPKNVVRFMLKHCWREQFSYIYCDFKNGNVSKISRFEMRKKMLNKYAGICHNSICSKQLDNVTLFSKAEDI